MSLGKTRKLLYDTSPGDVVARTYSITLVNMKWGGQWKYKACGCSWTDAQQKFQATMIDLIDPV